MKPRNNFIRIQMTYILVIIGFFIFSVAGNIHANPVKQELIFLNWPEYMDPDLIKDFEKKFNSKVKDIYFETENARNELLALTMGKGYDVILASDVSVLNYIKQNWLAPINLKGIPNLKHIDPKWLSATPKITAYAVPYLWGTLGIAYRKDLVKEEVTSWKQLLQPAETLRGKILMINDSRDTIGMTLKFLGYSVNTTVKEELAEAERVLLAQKPFVKEYGYLTLTEESGLLTGAYWMAMVYNGDALSLQDFNPNIAFCMPSEGTNIWMDYLMVMETSKKKELAMAFINFLNEPENAARLAEFVNYATPNESARKFLPKDHLQNPVIYSSKEVLDRSEFYHQLPPRIQKKYNSIFSKLLHGQLKGK